MVGRFSQDPGTQHWEGVRRILKYLYATKELKLTYTSKNTSTAVRLTGMVDSDWAGDKDTRKSTTGHVFYLDEMPISWLSKSQKSVACSSCEAEYIALSSAAQEGIYLLNLLTEMKVQVQTPVVICQDNQGSIAMAENPVHHSKAKPIDIRYHFVRELVEDKKIQLQYIPSANNTADILTKPLERTKHNTHLDNILGGRGGDGAQLARTTTQDDKRTDRAMLLISKEMKSHPNDDRIMIMSPKNRECSKGMQHAGAQQSHKLTTNRMEDNNFIEGELSNDETDNEYTDMADSSAHYNQEDKASKIMWDMNIDLEMELEAINARVDIDTNEKRRLTNLRLNHPAPAATGWNAPLEMQTTEQMDIELGQEQHQQPNQDQTTHQIEIADNTQQQTDNLPNNTTQDFRFIFDDVQLMEKVREEIRQGRAVKFLWDRPNIQDKSDESNDEGDKHKQK
jgi:hypothetical protein